MHYPIDGKNDRLSFGIWLGRMLGLLQASLSISSNELEAAKEVFSEGFQTLFPSGKSNLNSIRIDDLVVNLEKEKEESIWRTYSRLLLLWIDLQEETLPGVDESKTITEQEFVNTLRLTKHNMEKLLV